MALRQNACTTQKGPQKVSHCGQWPAPPSGGAQTWLCPLSSWRWDSAKRGQAVGQEVGGGWMGTWGRTLCWVVSATPHSACEEGVVALLCQPQWRSWLRRSAELSEGTREGASVCRQVFWALGTLPFAPVLWVATILPNLQKRK